MLDSWASESSGARSRATSKESQTKTQPGNFKTPGQNPREKDKGEFTEVSKAWAQGEDPPRTPREHFQAQKSENQSPNSVWPTLYPIATGTQEKPVREFPWASPHLLILTFKSHLSPRPWTAQPPKEPQFCGGTDRRVQTGRCWHCKYLLQVMLCLDLQLLGETDF